jgi:hypothetical protein
MIQRSSTYIMSVKKGISAVLGSELAGLVSYGMEFLMTIALWNENSDANVADRISASFPIYSNKEIQARTIKAIAEADRCFMFRHLLIVVVLKMPVGISLMVLPKLASART